MSDNYDFHAFLHGNGPFTVPGCARWFRFFFARQQRVLASFQTPAGCHPGRVASAADVGGRGDLGSDGRRMFEGWWPDGARFLEHPLTSVQKRSQSGKFNVLRWCLGYLEAQLAIISNHFSPCHGRHTDLCSCKRTSARARLANLPVCWATRA